MTICLQKVSVAFDGQAVLKELGFTIAEDSFVSLIAPSGAGKSTILKLLTGVLRPDTGTILVDGETITGLNTKFSYLPQEDMLLPWLSVYQNATLYQKLHHLAADPVKIKRLLAVFGLAGTENLLPDQLSGGMRQRAAVLRTMLNPASYLLLDEPFGALDAMTRSLMQDWLLALPADLKRTTILVTHDIEEALYLSDRILVLSAKPARIIRDIPIQTKRRDRQWLLEQAPLKETIYQLLKEESDAN